MADETIKAVLPVIKTGNALQNKKALDKGRQPAHKKSAEQKAEKKKGVIDTYA